MQCNIDFKCLCLTALTAGKPDSSSTESIVTADIFPVDKGFIANIPYIEHTAKQLKQPPHGNLMLMDLEQVLNTYTQFNSSNTTLYQLKGRSPYLGSLRLNAMKSITQVQLLQCRIITTHTG